MVLHHWGASEVAKFTSPESESLISLYTLRLMLDRLFLDITPEAGDLAATFVYTGYFQIWRALDKRSGWNSIKAVIDLATTVFGQTT
ncbi:hypothetical protein FRC07_003503 [Ceratobasidium sp. 392]|nr:hypothetical protein FRC07_003503 [Ceratobasidium sp. 392]